MLILDQLIHKVRKYLIHRIQDAENLQKYRSVSYAFDENKNIKNFLVFN